MLASIDGGQQQKGIYLGDLLCHYEIHLFQVGSGQLEGQRANLGLGLLLFVAHLAFCYDHPSANYLWVTFSWGDQNWDSQPLPLPPPSHPLHHGQWGKKHSMANEK